MIWRPAGHDKTLAARRYDMTLPLDRLGMFRVMKWCISADLIMELEAVAGYSTLHLGTAEEPPATKSRKADLPKRSSTSDIFRNDNFIGCVCLQDWVDDSINALKKVKQPSDFADHQRQLMKHFRPSSMIKIEYPGHFHIIVYS
jgi:hypothetical protein